jgi:UDP-N-acetylglucosamine--N-acetylmuramyl-(pentapeptide) pyrophosphoryl-undecaprenol N-acetylglucosamine transferase
VTGPGASNARRPRPPFQIVIAGGGTGGHTAPGLAVAAVLRAQSRPFVWIGSRTGIEARRAPESGIPYFPIPTGKLRRAWTWQNVPDLTVNFPAGIGRAVTLLRRFQPCVVLATGGYVALPVVLAAGLTRVPVVVHEQTSVPGVANRLAARMARRVAITFQESARWFPSAKVVVTGNPLRPELRGGARSDAVARFGLDPTLPTVYVTGGALGAHRINRTVGAALPRLLEHAQVIHQCGDNADTGDRAWLEARRAELPAPLARRYTVVPFISAELASIYATAALLVTRAGAGTVNECCQLGLPALYIPLPGTRGDEQTMNARLVKAAGGGDLLPQASLTPENLTERVMSMLADPRRLKEMGERARTLAIPDAAERLVGVLTDVG